MTSRLRFRSKGTLALVGVLLLYGLLSVKRSEVKPLWFDELGTLNVATQPTLTQMFRVEPADGNPPLQYLLIRPCLHGLGVNALALRLPAMLGVALALVCLYVFVGRRFGATAGLLAPTLLLFSRLSDYGVEARPYGLLMGLTALLLVLWQRAASDEPRRGLALAGLAATLFALTIAQPMGFLWGGVPLLAAEVTRWWHSRRLDRGMLLAILAGFSGFAVTISFGMQTQRVLSAAGSRSHSTIALPTLGKFAQAMQVEGLPPALALLLLLGAAAWWMRRTKSQPTGHAESVGAPVHEWVAMAAWALTIFAVYLFTALVTHYFWARYIAPGIIAWFALMGMLCGLAGLRRRTLWTVGVGVLGIVLIVTERRGMVAKTAATPQAQDSVTSSLLARADPANSSEPIVIAKPFFFPETWWYSSLTMRPRLHYIANAPHASETTDFVPEMTLLAMHNAGSQLFPPDSLNGFLGDHAEFLLWHHYTAQGCWLEDYLHAQRYTFTTVASSPTGDETLYEVTAPVESH